MVFGTLAVRREGAAVFAEIAAPPMNLLGPPRCWTALLMRGFKEEPSL